MININKGYGMLSNLSVNEIKKYHKNRYPWFFMDKVSSVIPGKFAEGIKLFSINETFFNSELSKNGIIPSFIVGEALEQMFLMTFLSLEQYKNLITNTFQTKIKFFKPVHSGEIMKIKSELKSFQRGIASGISTGYLNVLGGVNSMKYVLQRSF